MPRGGVDPPTQGFSAVENEAFLFKKLQKMGFFGQKTAIFKDCCFVLWTFAVFLLHFSCRNSICKNDAFWCFFKGFKAVLKIESLQLVSLIEKGVIFYGAGGALGFDTIAVECVLELKEKYP